MPLGSGKGSNLGGDMGGDSGSDLGSDMGSSFGRDSDGNSDGDSDGQTLEMLGIAVIDSFMKLKLLMFLAKVCRRISLREPVSGWVIASILIFGVFVLPAFAVPASGSKFIDFPTGQSVGKLYDTNIQSTGEWECGRPLGEARGRVRLPASARVYLNLNWYGASHLDFLDRLAPDDLSFLDMSNGGRGFETSDAEFVRLSRLTGLRGLDLESTDAAVLAMTAIGKLPELESLNVGTTAVTSGDLACLSKMKKLQVLIISHNTLSDQALTYIKDLKDLRVLYGNRCGFTSAGLANIAKLTNLYRLRLGTSAIDDAGVEKLPPMPHLTELGMEQCKLSDRSFAALRKFPALTELNLDDARFSPAGLKHLACLKKLMIVNISGTKVKVADLGVLRELPKVFSVFIRADESDYKSICKAFPKINFTQTGLRSKVYTDVFR